METFEQELKVPKKTVSVDLALMGHKVRRVEIYLVPHGDGTSSRQELIDLLLQDREFLPAEDVEGGQRFLFNTRKVLWISLPSGEHPSADREEEWLDRQHPACLELEDGTMLVGQLLYSARADNARVLDHLNNSEEPYLRLRREGAVVLVNKACVARVYDQGQQWLQGAK